MNQSVFYTYDRYEIHNVKRTINNIKSNVNLLADKIRNGETKIKDVEACIKLFDVINVHLTQLLALINDEILISDIVNV